MTSQTKNNPGKAVSIWATIFIVVAVVGMLGSLPVEHPTPMLYLAVIGLGGAFISLIWNISGHKDEASPLVSQGEKTLEALKNIAAELKADKQSQELLKKALEETAASVQSSIEKLMEPLKGNRDSSDLSLQKISEGLGKGNAELAEEIRSLANGIHEQLQSASGASQAGIGEMAEAVRNSQETGMAKLSQSLEELAGKWSRSQQQASEFLGNKIESLMHKFSETQVGAENNRDITGELKQILGEFSHNVTQNLAEPLANLNSGLTLSLSELKSTLDKMREDVSLQNESLKESLSAQSHEIVEELKNQGELEREEIKSLALSSDSASGDTGMLGSAIENLGGRLEEMLSHGREEMAALIEGQKELQDLLKNQVEPMAKSQAGNFGEAVEKLASVSEGLMNAGKLLEEASTIQHLNQSSLQAGIEMLNTSLLDIMEKLDSGHKQSEEQNEFIEKLYKTLEAFHEKATEILIENSLKTREVLLHGLPDTSNPTLDL